MPVTRRISVHGETCTHSHATHFLEVAPLRTRPHVCRSGGKEGRQEGEGRGGREVGRGEGRGKEGGEACRDSWRDGFLASHTSTDLNISGR